MTPEKTQSPIRQPPFVGRSLPAWTRKPPHYGAVRSPHLTATPEMQDAVSVRLVPTQEGAWPNRIIDQIPVASCWKLGSLRRSSLVGLRRSLASDW